MEIKAKNKPTVLERLLQVTRYRGFSVVDLSVKPEVKSQLLNIQLTVQSLKENERFFDNNYQRLSSQLAKLFDITQIKQLSKNSIKSQVTSVQSRPINHDKLTASETFYR